MLNKYLVKFVILSFIVTLVLALRLASWPAMVPCPDALAGEIYTLYTVNTVVDENDGSCNDGSCSLRDAIILANDTPGSIGINFDIQSGCGSSTCTIYPDTPLPPLTGSGITIDGSDSHKWIQIDGSNADSSNGFVITSANNVIKGLVIKKFQGYGVVISGDATGNVISNNYIGTDASSTANQGNGLGGVYISAGALNNTIEDNVISGNGEAGIVIRGSDAMNNTVLDNHIGTTADGIEALGNYGPGVYIFDGAQNNTIAVNLISGNDGDGIVIRGSDTMNNTVSGNYIGTAANGVTLLSNSTGVSIFNGAQNNTIESNVISGNGQSGVYISDSGTTGNIIADNYIGTTANGTEALGNAYQGVSIRGGAQNNTIEHNVISGNDREGIVIQGSDTMNNTVSGNCIGTKANGTEALGNAYEGVFIHDGAQNNTIDSNVISGNGTNGIAIGGSDTMNNTVSNNHIGTKAMGNNIHGICIHNGAHNNTIGPDNVITHNGWDGVSIYNGAHNNIVGPDNVIAHNGDDGVEIAEGSTTGITITQNSIYSNTMGIRLTSSGNGNIAAPAIFTTTTGSVNIIGAACPNCTVEVFQNSDDDGEGETYVENTTADASGAFTITVASLSKSYLTATATDGRGTSEFSAPFPVTVPSAPAAGKVYLPIIIRN